MYHSGFFLNLNPTAGVYDSRIHGPEPIIVFVESKPPSASFGMIQKRLASASTSRKAAFGSFSLNTTVEASGYSSRSMNATCERFAEVSAVIRPHEYLMSSVPIARPFTGATL